MLTVRNGNDFRLFVVGRTPSRKKYWNTYDWPKGGPRHNGLSRPICFGPRDRAPWEAVEIRFSREQRQLDIWVDFPPGSAFACRYPSGPPGAKVYDSEKKTWRNLTSISTAPTTARPGAPGRVPWRLRGAPGDGAIPFYTLVGMCLASEVARFQ